tara:strand:- start:959 stop:1162 length:204 start_codon:yes stop_codon:yes gene_type:complete
MDNMKDTIHAHDLRINSVEIKHETLSERVVDILDDRKKALWIVLAILISGLVYAGLAGLEGVVDVYR